MKNPFIASTALLLGLFFSLSAIAQEDLTRREYLQQLLEVLPEDRTATPGDQLPGTPPPHVSPQDCTWGDWLERTGELPPEFDEMPSLPFLPDPLILDEGGKNIPVETIEQWHRKREQMKKQTQQWITGTVPPPPDNLQIKVLEEKMKGKLREREVLLSFIPDHKAKLHMTLLIPPGEGPFPVFICPWKKDRYDWVQAAVRRGYIGCRFTATDPKYGYPDDSEAYEYIWWPEYDFSTIMRWGWAASRAIDYLYTLDEVNKEQIALTGLSRNGKMALWAASYDERIKAVVPISGGTGGENPFRYTTDKYNNETMQLLTWYRPHWLHPRLRFFVGRESKLPVDQNSLMALVAPRGLMLTSSITESAGNPWGIEQAYRSAKKAYKFLGAEDKIAIDLRHGLHAPSARDMERYLDFFDHVFERGDIKPDNKLFYNYTFSKWLGLSEEMLDPLSYPVKGIDDLLEDSRGKAIQDTTEWKDKLPDIKQRISWGLGEEPSSVAPGKQPDYMREVVGLPRVGKGIGSRPLMFGRLYYPSDESGDPKGDDLPVVIYLHEYSYSKGFAKAGDIITRFADAGYAVYAFDQIGFGTRIEEGRLFYERFPHWSKMGRMVADTRWAVDALLEIDFIDSEQIYAAGYSLGATVGLYSAALDERIAGMISVCGFTPMRLNKPEKTAEGIYVYSHLHGLLPRLGFFAKNESHIPYDFHEILAAIAPRPLLIVAPTWDQYASFPDVKDCVEEVRKVYDLYHQKDNLELYAPVDYNRFSDEMKEQVVRWLKENME
ncbi:MAG: alpha/beta fold hydrolase [Bacteroidales bacterium]